VNYLAYKPVPITHCLNSTISQISYIKAINETGYEYTFVADQDYKLSEDGYSVYFLDIYNTILKSGNFTLYNTFQIKYHAPLSRKVDLGHNILLTLQDSLGNDIPIDIVDINDLGLFEYEKTLKETGLSLPLGGGKKLVHMSLTYLPVSIYNKSSGSLISIDYEDSTGNKIYSYAESNKWVKPFTITTIPERVKLVMINDIKQNMVIEQQFIEERDYLFNYNPAEALESGEEYTRVKIDALVKEDYTFRYQLTEFDGSPLKNQVVWLQVSLMPKSKSKFLNPRTIIDEYGVSAYYESLGTEDVTFRGPGTSTLTSNKMFGKPLTYEIDSYNEDYSAYGPWIWTNSITDAEGVAEFNVSLDHDFLKDFMDIFGAVEGINSLEDVVLYIRAFNSYFDWDDFAIDTPEKYYSSKDGNVYDGSVQASNITQSTLQDSTYVEGLLYLHKNRIVAATNDYYTYDIPDTDVGAQFEPLKIHLFVTEADPLPTGDNHTVESLTSIRDIKELESNGKNVFSDDYTYYTYIDFINPAGEVVESFYKQLHEGLESGYFTIDNETMVSVLSKTGPGISSIRIQVAESEFYTASPPIFAPLEVHGPEWVKFGQKNVEIDLIDPFINAYGSVFNGETLAPFESNYDHLIGTLWIDPDFMGTEDEKELSIQDYIQIDLICTLADGSSFPLREGVMLRPVNREGILRFDIGLGPEDSYLMGLTASLNLSFNIDYNLYNIYEDDRDVTICLLDLKLEKNPSSSTPDTTWSLYENGFTSTNSDLYTIDIEEDTVDVDNGIFSLGGIENDVKYGLEVGFTYDPEVDEYAIA
ncbi:MAG: hypothetical protein ACW99Q_24190, partial [Candidatus Kariarchaeaceae archaeon]